jgi:DNA polymerase I
MKTDWLVLDVNNLGYRALHTTGDLRHEGEATGVTFGILRDIANLCRQFDTRRVIPCFDLGKSKREIEFPYYKETRRKKVRTEDEEHARGEMRHQLKLLRTEYFDQLGITNVLATKGLEADDMMALAVRSLAPDERAVLVTTDKDLYQLLSKRVAIWNPHSHVSKLLTAGWFRREYGIEPGQWVRVKCLAGCDGDDIPGIDGVAEATAVKFITGQMKNNATWQKIQDFKSSQQYADNLRLVSLCGNHWGVERTVPLDRDTEPNPDAWADLARSLGMDSLVSALRNEKTARGPVGAARG